MTQDQCLQTPSHFTHLGVCYVGSDATMTLSSPQDPQPVVFQVNSVGVPEPSMLILALIAAAVMVSRKAFG